MSDYTEMLEKRPSAAELSTTPHLPVVEPRPQTHRRMPRREILALMRAGKETGLEHRYSASPSYLGRPLVYEFTDDAALQQQYFQMRENMFISVWGLKSFYGQQDRYDPISHILVARQGKLCVGGIRVTYSSPQDRILLPMEEEGFRLADALPDLDLTNRTYGEFSRYAVLPDFQGNELAVEVSRQLFIKSIAMGADYCFAVCPLVQARNYRRMASMIGVKCLVRHDVKMPERDSYEGIPMYLNVFDVRDYVARLRNVRTARAQRAAELLAAK